MFDAIGRFDGSCLVDQDCGRGGGAVRLRAANTITINLMHEIVTGGSGRRGRTKTFAENAAAYTLGRPAPYAERLQFVVPQGNTHDPDESMMAGAMARQAVGKVKDLLTGAEEGPSSR